VEEDPANATAPPSASAPPVTAKRDSAAPPRDAIGRTAARAAVAKREKTRRILWGAAVHVRARARFAISHLRPSPPPAAAATGDAHIGGDIRYRYQAGYMAVATRRRRRGGAF
jgi:hypothetical protein